MWLGAGFVLALGLATNAMPDLHGWSRFERGGHPDFLPENSGAMDLAWCSWHEGESMFDGNRPRTDEMLTASCVVNFQGKSRTARARIHAMSPEQIAIAWESTRNYFNQPGNGGYEMVKKNVGWVIYHEGRADNIFDAVQKEQLGRVRSIYVGEQKHNPHVTKLLSAVSDDTLLKILKELGYR